MKKRKRKQVPLMILWDRRSQVRFVEAVERFVGLVGDLEVLLAAPKRRSAAAKAANETRRAAAANVSPNGSAEPAPQKG